MIRERPPIAQHRQSLTPQSPSVRLSKAQTLSLGKRRVPVTLPALPPRRSKP